MVDFADPEALLAIALALALGGTLKGATGAGAPILAVPVIAAFFDVRVAVAIMVVPNLLTNLWQMRAFRAHRLPGGFAGRLALAGAIGAMVGTVILAELPLTVLQLLMAGIIVAYIALRLMRPAMRLSFGAALRIVLPTGAAAGILQGAAGISAPIAISFLNAMRLERPVFIFTVSVFFAAMSAVQIPVLFAYGLMTPKLFGLGVMALVPLLTAMPLGAWLARRLTAQTFDRVMLTFLGVLALRLIYGALG